MNQLCKVCGEPAAGFHFGAFTCEGCKSFFGRTYNNISAISGCKNNGDCVINKKNRTACKACRLRKCLLVGMSKSGSRYGRRSNWFKIHCLLQEQQSQQQQQQQQTNNNGTNQSQISSNLEQFSLAHQHMLAKQTYQDKTNPSIKTATLQTSNVLMHPFLPVHHILNGSCQYPQSKSEPVHDSRTPSDSGASSADPEENYSSSNKDTTASSRDEEKYSPIKFDTTVIRSSSEPLKNFPILNGNNNRNNYIASAFHHIQMESTPSFPQQNNNNNTTTVVIAQDEPIDLSVKTTQCKTISNTLELVKPAPLDLTLVRSQPMSG